jgi:hypothetical protein
MRGAVAKSLWESASRYTHNKNINLTPSMWRGIKKKWNDTPRPLRNRFLSGR